MSGGAPPEWWRKPRRVRVVVDNASWILPFAERLVRETRATGDDGELVRDYVAGDARYAVTFLLGCVRLAPPAFLAQSKVNLVVHESDLPRGRGFAPLTWQILDGKQSVPICLLHAAEIADAGDVVYRDVLNFQGHELHDELRIAQGNKTIELCRRYLAELAPPETTPQSGEASWYPRRRPKDGRIDPTRPLAEQFNLLRVADNDRYPAFFELDGYEYVLRIEKRRPHA